MRLFLSNGSPTWANNGPLKVFLSQSQSGNDACHKNKDVNTLKYFQEAYTCMHV